MEISLKREQLGVEDSFTDFDDAVQFFDSLNYEKAQEGWELEQGSSIRYVNNQFQAFLVFSRGSDGSHLN